MAEIPQTHFVRSGDADLAYQVFGAGEDMVAIPGLPSHLEVMWELPEFAAFLDRLANFRRVITFEKRGTGMSDRVPGVPTLEQQVDDIIAVMDAAGSARASVAGWADGAFMAAMFAATYPERVSALVLGGLWLKALAGPPGTLAPDPDVAQRLSGEDRIRLAPWCAGGGAGSLVCQGRAVPVLVAAVEVYSATPAAAAGLLRWAATFDPAPILPAIQAPTLVLERSATYRITTPGGSPPRKSRTAGMCSCPVRIPCRTWGTPMRWLMRSRNSSPAARGTIRGLRRSSTPSCSPTSSARPRGQAPR